MNSEHPEMVPKNLKLAVIGLGYVGLPLAVEFGKTRPVIGFDISESDRIQELRAGIDRTLEVEENELREAKNLIFTTDKEDLKTANCYIVTVPTPINSQKKPDLTPLFCKQAN
jgi:UDP-N-acetyl-D-galactosamine dehydrogenase